MQSPRCDFPTGSGPCGQTVVYGIYTGMLRRQIASLCAEHIAEGYRQVKAQHPDWMVVTDHLTGAVDGDGKSLPVVVKEYPSASAYQQDAPVMALNGYQVIATSEAQQNAGPARILTLGLASLVVKPKAHYIVTYKRMADAV